MSGKNAKHSQPKAQQDEWRVYCTSAGAVPIDIQSSSLSRRGPDGPLVFTDGRGTVAEFPASAVVIRKPRREALDVPLPARFITSPESVAELQAALRKATGLMVTLLPPSSKAADAVSEPQ